VTVLCDGGTNYQSRLFDRDWLDKKGLAAAAPLRTRAPLALENILVV